MSDNNPWEREKRKPGSYLHRDIFLPKKGLRWIEDMFSAASLPGMSDGETRDHLGSSLTRRQIILFIGVSFLVFSIIITRLIILQLMHGREYLARSERNRERVTVIPAERGLVFDRRGIPLTENIPKLSLTIVPQDMPRGDTLERERIIRRLHEITGRDTLEIRRYITESIPAILEDNLDYETALMLQIEAADLPGVRIDEGSRRRYLNVDASTTIAVASVRTGTSTPVLSLSHILGYEGRMTKEEMEARKGEGYRATDSIGKTGVELSYESTLRGVDGYRRREVDFLEVEQKVLAEVAPVRGSHLTLALDINIQQAAEKFLRESLQKNGKTRGSVIALDPRNGDILALVSWPAFNNNDFSGGISSAAYKAYLENPDRPLFQRAIAGTYPSGSTVKPVVAAAALNEGIITPKTTVQSTGGLFVGVRFFPDWLPGGHGTTDVRRSIAWSVNTFYYYIGGGYGSFEGLGVDRISDYLKRFHLGSKLGIDIPGERSGFVPTREWKERVKKERWYVGDTYNLSIGQGDLLVTPLQIAAMTGAVATGGKMYTPRIVRGTIPPNTTTTELLAPKILLQDIVPTVHLRVVQAGMRDCVLTGACQQLQTIPIPIAGKTGTAQWNANRPPHAWFTSYAPAENPEIVFTVMVEEGEGGSSAAVPVANSFYRWWAEYRKMR